MWLRVAHMTCHPNITASSLVIRRNPDYPPVQTLVTALLLPPLPSQGRKNLGSPVRLGDVHTDSEAQQFGKSIGTALFENTSCSGRGLLVSPLFSLESSMSPVSQRWSGGICLKMTYHIVPMYCVIFKGQLMNAQPRESINRNNQREQNYLCERLEMLV